MPQTNQAIIITNQWGARLVTCAAHRKAQERYLYGDKRVAGETAEECPKCREERIHAEQPAVVRAALLDAKFSHTRFRDWCGSGSVYVYHRDPSSPSGVHLAASIDEARFDAIYNDLRASGLIGSGASPLSPTEGLCAPSQGRW